MQVAALLDGWPRDRPAHIAEVVALLQRLGVPAQGGMRALTAQELLNVLLSRRVVIAFVMPTNGPVGHYIVIEGFDPNMNALIVADPATGLTRYQTIQDLYFGWRWMATVIAG